MVLFRLIYNQTEELQSKVDYFKGYDKIMLAEYYESEMNVLDTIGKKVMHSRAEVVVDSKLKMREDEGLPY
jgi:diketogulonate reductase-like aldo/keto reductase